jgi:ribA/ribD-fused uncharacterized protein
LQKFLLKSFTPPPQTPLTPSTTSGHTWTCTEHYYVHEKLLHFGNHDAATSIYQITASGQNGWSPAKMKEVGRVTEESGDSYSQELWTQNKVDVMLRCAKEKFRQNPHLRDALLATGDAELVEASRRDLFWGSGVEIQALEKQADTVQWRIAGGRNMMGVVLMWVRDWLRDLMAKAEAQGAVGSGGQSDGEPQPKVEGEGATEETKDESWRILTEGGGGGVKRSASRKSRRGRKKAKTGKEAEAKGAEGDTLEEGQLSDD